MAAIDENDFEVPSGTRSFQAILCPDLPIRDPRGWKTGKDYVPLINGKWSAIGTASTLPGVKTGRDHECLSLLERRLHYLLELRPDVLDFREQYPLYDEEQITKLLRDYGRISRQKIPTVDFVLTLRDQITGGFRYHVLNVKYTNELHKEAVWHRFIREKSTCATYGWGWTFVTEKDISSQKAKMARRICKYCGGVRENADFGLAPHFTKLFKKLNPAGGSLDAVLKRVARRLECSLNQAYILFGIACILGYLTPDIGREIGPNHPLVLQ